MKLPHSSKCRPKGSFDLHSVSYPGWQLRQNRRTRIPVIQEHNAGKVPLVPNGPAYGLVYSLHTQILYQYRPWQGLTLCPRKCLIQVGHLLLQLWRLNVGIWHPHHHHTPVVGHTHGLKHQVSMQLSLIFRTSYMWFHGLLGCMCLYTCVWRPEEDVRCCPSDTLYIIL